MQTDNTTTICFNKIRQLILDGNLSPGEKLKGEYLKQKLGVGLSPVREALFRLVETSLVRFEDKVGFHVAMLTEKKVYDIFETHAKIECLVLNESIKNGDDEWEADIMSKLYKLAKIEKNDIKIPYSSWTTRNDEFHNALISGCKINGLISIRNNYLQMKEWCSTLANKNDKDHLITTSHSEHAKIAELAIARKAELATSKLYNHIMTVVSTLVTKLKTDKFITN